MRIFQASGLAFLFVPINTMSYTDVPREKNNDVSGLTNLARNIGGSAELLLRHPARSPQPGPSGPPGHAFQRLQRPLSAGH